MQNPDHVKQALEIKKACEDFAEWRAGAKTPAALIFDRFRDARGEPYIRLATLFPAHMCVWITWKLSAAAEAWVQANQGDI